MSKIIEVPDKATWIYLMQKKKNWDTSRNIHILKYIEDYKKEKQLKRFDVLWKE